MKKQVGIWMDGTKAIIITLNNGAEEMKFIESHIENRVHHDNEGDKGSFFGSRHIDHEKKFDERRKHQLQKYLDEILEYVADANSIYIFGPAQTKTELEKALFNKKTFAGSMIKVESADHMTLNQIIAKVKDYYLIH